MLTSVGGMTAIAIVWINSSQEMSRKSLPQATKANGSDEKKIGLGIFSHGNTMNAFLSSHTQIDYIFCEIQSPL